MSDSDENVQTIPIHIKKNLIQVVIRQTDYDNNQAENELEKYGYDVKNVIRNYINPQYDNNKKDDKNTLVTNIQQQKFTEIRTMMDDASKRYRQQKELEEYNKQLLENYQQVKSRASDNLKKNIK